MASPNEVQALLEAIHLEAKAVWPVMERAAAATLIDEKRCKPDQASWMMQLAEQDNFLRGKVKDAQGLLKNWAPLDSVAGVEVRAPRHQYVGPQDRPSMKPADYGNDYPTFRSPASKADFEKRKGRLASSIRAAEARGLRGPALMKAVLGGGNAFTQALTRAAEGVRRSAADGFQPEPPERELEHDQEEDPK